MRGGSLPLVAMLGVLIIGGSLEVSTTGISVLPGEEVEIELKATNPYTFPLELPLEYTAPEGFEGWFEVAGLRVNSLRLGAGESAALVFRLRVPEGAEPGRYTLRLRAFGTQRVELRVVRPSKAVQALVEVRGAEVEAGERLEIPAEVRSLVDVPLVVNFSCRAPAGWRCGMVYGDAKSYSITLPAGGTRSLRVEVETPSEELVGDYVLRLGFTTVFGELQVPLYVRISESHRGENGTLRLRVVGRDGVPVASAEVLVEELNLSYHTGGDGEAVMELPPGTYSLLVSGPGYYSERLEASVRAGWSEERRVVLGKRPYAVEMVVENPVLSQTLGETPVFRVRLINLGYMEDEYRLGVEGLPEGFYYRFKEEAGSPEGVSAVYLRGGEERTLYLELVLPPNARPGEYSFRVSASGRSEAREEVRLRLRGEYRVMIEPLEGYMSTAAPGEVAEVRVRVVNAGRGGTLTRVNLSAEAPEGWGVEAVPQLIPVLEPGGSAMAVFRLRVPPDALPSEYMVRLRAVAEQSSAGVELRVRVRERGAGAVLGVAIILLTLIALVVVYRRFGRR